MSYSSNPAEHRGEEVLIEVLAEDNGQSIKYEVPSFPHAGPIEVFSMRVRPYGQQCDEAGPGFPNEGPESQCPEPAVAAINGFSGPDWAAVCQRHLNQYRDELAPRVWVKVLVDYTDLVALVKAGAVDN